MFRTVLAVTLMLAAAGCGSASRSGSEQTEKPPATPIAQELPCEKLPPEASCPGPAPARPVPMSPDGPVHSFKSEYLGTEVMISANGVYGVAATAPETFAVTGTVYDARSTQSLSNALEGAAVTFSSISGQALPAPPGGDVRVATRAGYDGAFSVINVPVNKTGTCYRMTVDAPGVGRYESVDVISAGVYEQSIELFGGFEMSEPLLRGSSLERACARTAQ